jgi:hypothetical protein
MKILKRRDVLTKTITVRVPEALKIELDQLRRRSCEAGFDLGATLREALYAMTKQIRSELDAIEHRTVVRPVDGSDRSSSSVCTGTLQ